MAPPPKPPVICYDLHSDGLTARRQRRQNTIPSSYIPPLASSCTTYRTANNILTEAYHPTQSRSRVQYNEFNNGNVNRNGSSVCFVRSGQKPYSSMGQSQAVFTVTANDSIFAPHPAATRQAFADRMRNEARERERRKAQEHEHKVIREQLEMITLELKSMKKSQEHIKRTFGMGHNAAKYIQERDEEISQLKQQVERIREVHLKDRQRLMQQIEKSNQLLKSKDEATEKQLLKDLTNFGKQKDEIHYDSYNNSSSSPSSDSVMNASPSKNHSSRSLAKTRQLTNCRGPQGSSSTISLTPSSSPSPSSSQSSMHITSSTPAKQHPSSIRSAQNSAAHFVTKTQQTPHKSILSNRKDKTQTLNKQDTPTRNIQFSTPIAPQNSGPVSMHSDLFHDANFSFDGSTLEVTDLDFFHKVEDPTMIELGAIMNRIKNSAEIIAQL